VVGGDLGHILFPDEAVAVVVLDGLLALRALIIGLLHVF